MVYMFHKDEPQGKVFEDTEDFNALTKLGWVDTPDKLEATQSRDELLEEARNLGLEFPSNVKTAKLIQMIEDAKNDSQTTN